MDTLRIADGSTVADIGTGWFTVRLARPAVERKLSHLSVLACLLT